MRIRIVCFSRYGKLFDFLRKASFMLVLGASIHVFEWMNRTQPATAPRDLSDALVSHICTGGYRDHVYCSAFLNNSLRVVAGGASGMLLSWSFLEGKSPQPLIAGDFHTLDFVHLQLSADDQLLLTCSGRKAIIFNATNGDQVIKFNTPATATAMSSNGRFVAVPRAEKNPKGSAVVDILQVDSGDIIESLSTQLQSPTDLLFSADGRSLYIADESGTIEAWQLSKVRCIFSEVVSNYRSDLSIALSPSENTLAWADPRSMRIGLLDPADGTPIQSRTTNTPVMCIRHSPARDLLVAGCFDGSLRFYALPSLEETAVLMLHSDAVYTVSFSSDGKYLASGGCDNCLKTWDLVRLLAKHSGSHNNSQKHR